MNDTITYISPDLKLITDENDFLTIHHDGKKIYTLGYKCDPDTRTREVFTILQAMTYQRKEYSDGSIGYWCNFRGGEEFWVMESSLYDVLGRASEMISMYLSGRDDPSLFDDILTIHP